MEYIPKYSFTFLNSKWISGHQSWRNSRLWAFSAMKRKMTHVSFLGSCVRTIPHLRNGRFIKSGYFQLKKKNNVLVMYKQYSRKLYVSLCFMAISIRGDGCVTGCHCTDQIQPTYFKKKGFILGC